MNLTGSQIKDTYEGVLNIGATGLTGALQEITDGLGNLLNIQVSDTTINFSGIVTGNIIGTTGAAGATGANGANGATGATGPAGATGAGASSPITLEQTNSLVSTAIGATAAQSNSVVIGATACSASSNTVVLGSGSCALQPNSIAIGKNATVISSLGQQAGKHVFIGTDINYINGYSDSGGSIFIGNTITAGGGSSTVVIGENSVGYNTSITIGRGSCSQDNSVAIGCNSRTNFQGAVSIGPNTCNCGTPVSIYVSTAVAIGKDVANTGSSQVSIGECLVNKVAYGHTIGQCNTIHTGATGTIVLGNSSVGATGACNSVVIGNSAQTTGACSVVIGQAACGTADCGITIGKSSCSLAAAAITIGNDICNPNPNIMIGNTVCSQSGSNNLAIGFGAKTGGDLSLSMVTANVNALAAIGIGHASTVTGAYGILLGAESLVSGSQAMGFGRFVNATHAGSVVLGNSLSSMKDSTVHVPNLIAYGQAASLANAIGSTGTAISVDWDNSNVQTLTITASGTLTMSNPIDGGVYTLQITQGGSGSNAITWSNVKWPGGTPPTLSTAVAATDILTFIYGPTAYFGNANLNFS